MASVLNPSERKGRYGRGGEPPAYAGENGGASLQNSGKEGGSPKKNPLRGEKI